MKNKSYFCLTLIVCVAFLLFGCSEKTEPELVKLDKNHALAGLGGIIEVDLMSYKDVTVMISDSIDWISYTIDKSGESHKLMLNCVENYEDNEREGQVFIYSDELIGVITVTQEALAYTLPVLNSFQIIADTNNEFLEADIHAEIIDDIICMKLDYTPASLILLPTIDSECDELFYCVGNDTIRDLTQKIDLSNEVECVLQNKKGKVSYTIQLSLSNGIPVMYINTKGKVEITSKEDYVDGEIRLDGVDLVPSMEASMKIKGRGNSTWEFPQKPYRIKFDKKQELAGFPAHKDWVLLANYIDPSLSKNALAFKISSLLEMEWSNRNVAIDVYLNGCYNGNYLLCEQIKIDKNRVNIAELTSSDIAGDRVTGGYLLELDTYFDEEQKFKSDLMKLPVMIKDPDLNDIQFNWIKDYFNSTEKILYSSDYLDPKNGYKNHIDINNFAKWWLIQELMGSGESMFPKSSYMCKDRNEKLKMGPVWDFDWYTVCTHPEGWCAKSGIWYDRLFSDPAFVNQVKDVWTRNRSLLEKEIGDYIVLKEKELALSAKYNSILWQ